MLYHVRMDVHPPVDHRSVDFEQLKVEEKRIAMTATVGRRHARPSM